MRTRYTHAATRRVCELLDNNGMEDFHDNTPIEADDEPRAQPRLAVQNVEGHPMRPKIARHWCPTGHRANRWTSTSTSHGPR